MSSEWQTFHLENCLDALIDYRGKTPKKTHSGIPLITAKVIKGGRIETPTEFIAAENYDAWMRRGIPNQGDVVLTVEAPLGEVAQLGSEKIALAQRVVTLRGKKDLLDNAYLAYWLQTESAQEQLRSRATGTTVIGIKQSELRKVVITIPSLDIQFHITSVLKAVDDRITLLRETNKTLESIAQAIFKSWFVDFDPVRAKMEGRQPAGMDEEKAALFPDEFQDSGLGLIPKNWTVRSFTDTVNVIGGGTPKTSVNEYWNGTIPWFSVVDAPASRDVFVLDTHKHISELGLSKSSASLLPVGTTIVSARGTVGKLALTGVPMSMNQSCYGLRGKFGDSYFTYFSLFRLIETLKQRTHGSVFDTITKNTLSTLEVAHADKEIIFAFEETVFEIMERIKNNLIQSKTLSSIRDEILPRLISGQLRVSNATEVEETSAI